MFLQVWLETQDQQDRPDQPEQEVKMVNKVHVDKKAQLEHPEEMETPVFPVPLVPQDLLVQVVTVLEMFFLLVKKDLVPQ